MKTDPFREKISRRIGENIREARLRNGLSQRGIAKQGLISQGNISEYESGRGLPQVDTLITLAAILGTTLADLLRGVDPNEKDHPGA